MKKLLEKFNKLSGSTRLGIVFVLMHLTLFFMLFLVDVIFDHSGSNFLINLIFGGFILNVVTCNFVNSDIVFLILFVLFPISTSFVIGFISGKFLEKINLKIDKRVIFLFSITFSGYFIFYGRFGRLFGFKIF